MPPESEGSKVVKDVSVVALVIAVIIVIVIIVTAYAITQFINGLTSGDILTTGSDPACWAWVQQRQQGYLSGDPPPVNQETGYPYMPCGALKQAISDTQDPSSAAPCPLRQTPPDVNQQYPYANYMLAGFCSD